MPEYYQEYLIPYGYLLYGYSTAAGPAAECPNRIWAAGPEPGPMGPAHGPWSMGPFWAQMGPIGLHGSN